MIIGSRVLYVWPNKYDSEDMIMDFSYTAIKIFSQPT